MLVQISNVRLAFPSIFKPSARTPQDVPYYSALFPVQPGSENDRRIKDAIGQVVKEKYGAKADKRLAQLLAKGDVFYKEGPKSNKEGDPYDGFEGMNHFRASNKGPLVIVDRKGHPVTEAQGLIYAGCYVNVQIDVWVQDNQHANRVNGKLLAIQFVKDGEPFGGGVRVGVDTFAPLEDEEEEDTADIG